MLRFENIELKAGERSLLSIPNLEIHAGIHALVGRNGSGKSTLIRAILGEHDEYEGRIEVDGHAIHSMTQEKLSKEIAVVYSKPTLFGNHTVSEVLMLGRLPYNGLLGRTTEEDKMIVYRVAALLHIEPLLDQPFQTLSDGEKQLIMIGRALVQDTPVLLMDEPSAFLDLVNRFQLVKIMKEVVEESNKLILFSTHHIDMLSDCCDHVYLINEQQIQVLSEINRFEEQVKQAFTLI